MSFENTAPSILRWFQKNRRDLPWRKASRKKDRLRDPYATWISEIMLQQTRVSAVLEHYLAWMKDYPHIEDLAKADSEELLRHWSGLGYYSRVRNIHRTALLLVDRNSGNFPRSRKELLDLPGIGDYTAGAVLSLAFGQNETILDGNCVRVFSRLQGLNFLPDNATNKTVYMNFAEAWVRMEKPQLANEALMEFGALLCTPKSPHCSCCPAKKHCKAHREKRVAELPPMRKKPVIVERKGIAVVVERQGQVLLIHQGKGEFLEGQLGFPLFWTKNLPSKLRPLPGMVRHRITKYRILLSLATSEKPLGTSKTGRWIDKDELRFHLTSGLHRKILDLYLKTQ